MEPHLKWLDGDDSKKNPPIREPSKNFPKDLPFYEGPATMFDNDKTFLVDDYRKKPSLISKLFLSVSNKSSESSSSLSIISQTDKKPLRNDSMPNIDRLLYYTHPQTHTLLSIPKKSSIHMQANQSFVPPPPPPPPVLQKNIYL